MVERDTKNRPINENSHAQLLNSKSLTSLAFEKYVVDISILQFFSSRAERYLDSKK